MISIPNGGNRSPITGAILKAEGATAGAADLVLLKPSSQYHALFIEMKHGKGKQSDSQKVFEFTVEGFGYAYRVCNSFDLFVDTVNNYLNGEL